MAKNAGRLAGLAALAGAAYMMSKDKDKAPKGKEDTGPGYKSTETRLESPEDTIKRSMKTAPTDDMSGENYSNEGYGKGINQAGATGTTTLGPAYNESSKPSALPKPSQPKTAVKDRRIVSPEEGAAKYKPRYTPSAMAPKTTEGATYGKKAYMPEDVNMSIGQKRGGMVKKMASGGMTASSRADGIAVKGKTRGKIC